VIITNDLSESMEWVLLIFFDYPANSHLEIDLDLSIGFFAIS